MTKAFLFCFLIAVFIFWVCTSIEYAKTIGANIKETIKNFIHGKEVHNEQTNE